MIFGVGDGVGVSNYEKDQNDTCYGKTRMVTFVKKVRMRIVRSAIVTCSHLII